MTNWYDNVPAPVDANGCVVPLDTKELVYRGEVREVCTFAYNTRYGCWGVYFENNDGISLNACTLLDSWEQLEQDAAKTPREYTEKHCIIVGKDGRVAAMARDLVARAKVLAGRDANGCDEERGRM